jgi:hypothetical protein
LLLLMAYSLATPHVFAETPTAVSANLRTEDHVHVSARRESPASDAIVIALQIDPGYHVNANPASNEYLIPTSVAFSGSAPERVVYPPARHFKPAFADKPIDVYEGAVVITATFAPGALDRAHDLDFTVTAQACTERICLPPDDLIGRAAW